MQTIKNKMTNLEVVQRTLDFWDPLGASIFSGGAVTQIDEYDRYAVEACKLLTYGTTESTLRSYLDEIRFKKMGLKRNEKSAAENRFYAWSLLQVWETQQCPDSNLRLVDARPRDTSPDGRLSVPHLRLVQMCLEEWDGKQIVKDWLWGADTINAYDEASIQILKLLQMGSSVETLAEAFGWIHFSQDDSVVFFLENPGSSEEQVRSRISKHIKDSLDRYTPVATNLSIAFAHFQHLYSFFLVGLMTQEFSLRRLALD